MSSDFTFEFRKDYVHIQHAPDFEITPESNARLWPALIAFCKKHKCNRVLSEATNPKRRMSTIDAYESGVAVAQSALALKIACCWTGYIPDDLSTFFQNVTSNRGVVTQFFSNREEALRWLGVDPD